MGFRDNTFTGGSIPTKGGPSDYKKNKVVIKSGNNKNKSKSSGGSSMSNNKKPKNTMNQSIAEGMDTFNKLTGGEGLSRIGDTKEYTQSTERGQAAIDRYKKRSVEGIGTAEREAQRTNMAQQMAQAQQLAGLRLGAMAGGAQGASAAAQQRSLQAQGMATLANVERDIFLQSEGVKREGEDKMSMAEHAMSKLQMEKAAFDIGQSNAETEMKSGLAMGIEGQKSAERSAQISADAQIKASQAQSSGISVVCTELHTQGIINTEVWKDSEAWGEYMGKTDREFMIAYWAIGIPTVNLMRKSKIASSLLGPIFKQGFDYLGGKKTLLTKAGFLLGVGLCEISKQVLRLKKKMKGYYENAQI